MAKVDKRKTAKKAAQTFIKYAAVVGGVLSQVEIPDGDLSDKVLITLGLSTALSIIRAVNNVRKRRKAPETAEQPLPYIDYKNITAALLVGLSLGLAGCVATQAKDGTWTLQVDQSALEAQWDRYEGMERRQTDLEREREQASPERVKAITRELEALEPEVRELAEVLGVALPTSGKQSAKKTPR